MLMCSRGDIRQRPQSLILFAKTISQGRE
jgi:hypothetical protein